MSAENTEPTPGTDDAPASETPDATLAAEPTIRVVSGAPTDEELAAVVAVLTARAAAAAASVEPPREVAYWGRPAHVRHGRPRSWAESTLPR